MPLTKKIQILESIFIAGKICEPGSVVELSPLTAQQIVGVGRAVFVSDDTEVKTVIKKADETPQGFPVTLKMYADALGVSQKQAAQDLEAHGIDVSKGSDVVGYAEAEAQVDEFIGSFSKPAEVFKTEGEGDKNPEADDANGGGANPDQTVTE